MENQEHESQESNKEGKFDPSRFTPMRLEGEEDIERVLLGFYRIKVKSRVEDGVMVAYSSDGKRFELVDIGEKEDNLDLDQWKDEDSRIYLG